MTATGAIAATVLLIVLAAAGGLVWWLNRRNDRPVEHNTVTGTGADL
ncbi:hypothetical protein SEA_ANGELIQUE_58 [Gordonia phage Angelique]|nr:hypothetical protein SEA_ANGELIQUE_58 [Gordonia phage Angelique]